MPSSIPNQRQVDYEREVNEWRRLVGQAILSFGDIELVTLKCLDRIPSDKISKASSALSFSQRIDLLVKIIEGRCTAPSPAAELAARLKATKPLAKVRNVIAHNPLQLHFYAHRLTGDMTTELAILGERSPGKSIDLASLKEYAAAVENSASELVFALGPALAQLTSGTSETA
jgi:hypothetical protein